MKSLYYDLFSLCPFRQTTMLKKKCARHSDKSEVVVRRVKEVEKEEVESKKRKNNFFSTGDHQLWSRTWNKRLFLWTVAKNPCVKNKLPYFETGRQNTQCNYVAHFDFLLIC